MSRHIARVGVVVLACAVLGLPSYAVTAQQKAWSMFESAVRSKNATQRAIGVQALGLLCHNPHARALVESALGDPRPAVRAAAATSLGQMQAVESIPKLQKLLHDPRMAVVMAAAHSLHDLKDNASANAIYLDILTGERKGDGMIAEQLETLHNPHELAMIGFEQGIGYLPFAGIGWDAWRYTHKKNPHPARAIAATILAHDPDPATGRALLRAAMNDKDWIVRSAAVEALAQRGDPSVEEKIELCMFDTNVHVRFTAAAAVIRLNTLPRQEAHAEAEKKIAQK
jgi:HEAT repeat protein